MHDAHELPLDEHVLAKFREFGEHGPCREAEDDDIILYGDPDAPEPKGIIDARSIGG